VYRYHNIYKNLIRDIKIHFRERFDLFKEELRREYLAQHQLNYNFPLSEAMLQLSLIQYIARKFSSQALN